MPEPTSRLELSVSDLTLSILEGFLAAAELHLGEENPNGVELARPEPMQAWLALKSAGALMDQLSTVMSEDVRVPLNARLTYLFERFEELLPPVSREPKLPPVASLSAIVDEALNELKGNSPTKPVSAPAPAAAPVIPGTGLPKRGSGLLFPPRGR